MTAKAPEAPVRHHGEAPQDLSLARGTGMDCEDRVQVEVTVNHQGNVTTARANQRNKPVTTHLRTLGPLPSGVS